VATLAETQRLLRERQTQATLKQEQRSQEKHKSEQRSRLTQLTAPVDGTVQQLAIHTAGGVVTGAQVLLIVAPKDAEVTAEVVLENKDVGLVQAGQHAEVKLETFPFTRYGTVQATVARLSADAVTDESRGAVDRRSSRGGARRAKPCHSSCGPCRERGSAQRAKPRCRG
jgi:hemolysin D